MLRLRVAALEVPERPPNVMVVRAVPPFTVPPFKASVPVPSAPALPSWSVPCVTVVPPAKELAEERATVPVAPVAALTARAPRPLRTLAAVSVTEGLAAKPPVVPERSSRPRLALKVVFAEAWTAPPAKRRVLTLADEGAVPRAASELIKSVPAPTTTELASPRAAIWKVFVPVRASVPAPYLWSMPLPLMTPPRVKVPALVVMPRVPVRTTAPVPRFRAEPLEPV